MLKWKLSLLVKELTMTYRLLAVAALGALAACVPPPAPMPEAPVADMPMTDMPAADAGAEQAVPGDFVPAN